MCLVFSSAFCCVARGYNRYDSILVRLLIALQSLVEEWEWSNVKITTYQSVHISDVIVKYIMKYRDQAEAF